MTSLTSSTRSGSQSSRQPHRAAAENVARAAGRGGLRQIVLLGGLGDDSPELSPHLRSRHETARARVGPYPGDDAARSDGGGRRERSFRDDPRARRLSRRHDLPTVGRVPTQPIALRDVTGYPVGVCGLGAAYDRAFDVGVPDVMTYRDMIERIARIQGKRRPCSRFRPSPPRLSSWWLHLVTLVNAAVARLLIEGLRNPTVARADAIRDLVPLELTPSTTPFVRP